MADLYQVIGWQAIFETSKTRTQDTQSKCLVPNKQNGDGYTQLLEMDNGEALYGAFHAMILYLSKQPARYRNGFLTTDGMEDGKRLTPAALAKGIRFSESTVKAMLTKIARDIGWIINHTNPSDEEMVAYPGKRVDLEFIIMAQAFHKIQRANYPRESGLQKSSLAKTNLLAARELEELTTKKEAPWTVKDLKAVLDWIPTNNFWKTATRTLDGISGLSRNKSLKIDNAAAIMKADFYKTLLTVDEVQEELKKGATMEEFEEVASKNNQESLWRRTI